MKIKNIFNFVYPDKCLNCGKITYSGTHFCDNCEPKVPFIKGKICDKCGRPLPHDAPFSICRDCRREKFWFSHTFVPFIYRDSIRKAILGLKFHHKFGSVRPLGSYMAHCIPSNITFDFVTYVPLHPMRFVSRGYNQSKLLASVIAKEKGLPLYKSLKRLRNTPKQSLLSAKERKENIKNAFQVCSRNMKDQTVLLVDDVYTTGSTLQECAKMLYRAGARKVYCCVCAIASE